MQVFSYTSPPNILANVAITKHNPKPVTVGSKNPIAVHFQLFVSFLIERQEDILREYKIGRAHV